MSTGDIQGPHGGKPPAKGNSAGRRRGQNPQQAKKAQQQQQVQAQANVRRNEPIISKEAAEGAETTAHASMLYANNDAIRHAIEQKYNINEESYEGVGMGTLFSLAYSMNDKEFDAGPFADFEEHMGSRIGKYSSSELLQTVQMQIQEENLS